MAKEKSGHVRLVGAVDIDPSLIGRRVDSFIGGRSDLLVSEDIDQALAQTKPQVVLHTTTSFLDKVKDQILHCVRGGAHVISSTEELAFPFNRYPEVSRELDEAAKKHGVVVLGTGVNPGYAMDTLALAATGVSTSVEQITVDRVVDASKRREPLQRKIGAGISAEEFYSRKKTGKMGHIGLRESLEVIAAGLDWSLDFIKETLDPVMAKETVKTPYLTVDRGRVAGIHQTAIGMIEGKTRVSLTLKMYVGASDCVDRVRVQGSPPIDMVVASGIFGDTATVGALINAIPRVTNASPGLHTMITLPVPRAFGA